MPFWMSPKSLTCFFPPNYRFLFVRSKVVCENHMTVWGHWPDLYLTWEGNRWTMFLTLASFPYFATFASIEGGPLSVTLETERRWVLQQKQQFAPNEYSRLMCVWFLSWVNIWRCYERSKKFFAKSVIFRLRARTSPYAINRSEMKISPSGFLFNYEHMKRFRDLWAVVTSYDMMTWF